MPATPPFLAADAMIERPMLVTAFLLGILGVLFAMKEHPTAGKVFKILPFLVFAYFVPTIFSNTGIIPLKSDAYGFIKLWFLPASLLLFTLSIDIPAIVGLGKNAVVLFFVATATIVLGGPIAYLALHWMIPESLGAEAWKGLAALSGSWIGGTANMVVIGEEVGVQESTFNLMVVVDVAVANIWMTFLLWYAGRDKKMDEAIGADRSSVDRCREKVESFEAQVSRAATLGDLMKIVAIAFVGTAIARASTDAVKATWVEAGKPDGGLWTLWTLFGANTWAVVMVTLMGVALSYTKVRNLEGAGASKIGSVFIYLLVASIGARAEFSKVVDAPALVAIGGLWMAIHAVVLLLVRRWLKAPIFFAAVGSKANIGGAASAPIVAAAFHPALAPVGILLAVAGYVVGTFAGKLCAVLLEMVHNLVG